ncbi:MAG: LptF/LptG family permease [Dysgonomonas sp.]|nr:LptF/LptG family permease [Dysgonomonas sp.]
MLKVKRLYTFLIQTFLPVFFMTFAICLFIVLMQFIWKYVEDFVGKGLENTVLAELFLYAALTLIPMALPLSLLLASLMAFGNLGERMELLAIKAAGVSLLKAMKPLIILVAGIAIGVFFFQNEAMPRIQVKFRALLISIKQKSPELDIPEGSFYSGIDKYSLYVKKKNPETKMLYDVMIYDRSKGSDNMTIIVCDSGTMQVSEDKDFLLLNLYYGQQFANDKQSGIGNKANSRSNNNDFIPYARENFKRKEIIIPFDGGFDRMDESSLEGTQISKNITKLEESIDSMGIYLDSINIRDRNAIARHTYLSYRNNDSYKNGETEEKEIEKEQVGKVNFDSLLHTFTRAELSQFYSTAASESENNRFNIIESTQKMNLQRNIRMHKVEWHRKFVYSFACLIFFFIGAPLGAIIRKGGLGMPVVVSVALFIVYYIIDNVGYKMARDGVWDVWQGMWLSSVALFPLGVFLTYKAMNDSALFNPEAYGKFFRKALFIKSPPKVTAAERNRMLREIPAISELNIEPNFLVGLQAMDSDKLRDVIQNFHKYEGYNKNMQLAALSLLKERGAELDDILNRQDTRYANAIYDYYCSNSLFANITYVLTLLSLIILSTGVIFKIVGIAYLLLFIRSVTYYFAFYKNIKSRKRIYHTIVTVVSLICYPAMFFFVKKRMVADIKEVQIIKD